MPDFKLMERKIEDVYKLTTSLQARDTVKELDKLLVDFNLIMQRVQSSFNNNPEDKLVVLEEESYDYVLQTMKKNYENMESFTESFDFHQKKLKLLMEKKNKEMQKNYEEDAKRRNETKKETDKVKYLEKIKDLIQSRSRTQSVNIDGMMNSKNVLKCVDEKKKSINSNKESIHESTKKVL